MLFEEFDINYSKIPAIFRKGSILLREQIPKDMDKDAIIPTLPETLPGSMVAKATPFKITANNPSSPDTPTEATIPENGFTASSSSSLQSPTEALTSAQDTPSVGSTQDTPQEQELDGVTPEDKKRPADDTKEPSSDSKPVFKRMKKGVVIDHIDIIGEKFWTGRGAYIIAPEKKKRMRTIL